MRVGVGSARCPTEASHLQGCAGGVRSLRKFNVYGTLDPRSTVQSYTAVDPE
jgi:hypothetical protein